MTSKQITLGQAIDQIVTALEAINVESRQTAIDAACAHLGIAKSSVNPQTPATPPANLSTLTSSLHATSNPPLPAIDIRTFKDQKKPKSAKQMACVVAFYLQELAPAEEKKETVTAKDMEKYFKQAKFELPKTISQLLPDAKQSGYFESVPGKGAYHLNAVGYNLVAHKLPAHSEK